VKEAFSLGSATQYAMVGTPAKITSQEALKAQGNMLLLAVTLF
jgi:hypothetical protein